MATAKKATEKVTNQTKKVTDQTKKVTEKIDISTQSPVLKAAHAVLQAGLGVLVIGKDELESAIEFLVEKGEVAEKESLEKVGELLDRGRTDVGKGQDKVESILDERIEVVLNTMNIPSKKDIDSLSRKISTLSRKVNALDKKVAAEKVEKVEKKAA
jgi:poly(hydroxyalkanoate) granule-associated protein